jgi:hypothetical protein
MINVESSARALGDAAEAIIAAAPNAPAAAVRAIRMPDQ